MKYRIEYWYGTYHGTRTVILEEDDQRDPIAVMWAGLSSEGLLTLPMASRSARITSQESTTNMSVLELCGVGDDEE